MSKDKAVATTSTSPDNIDLSSLEAFRAEAGEKVAGLESLDRSDFKLPKIKLIQSTSAEAQRGSVPAGSFYNTITKAHTRELPCSLLLLGKSRVMWKQPFKRGETALCQSYDSITKFDNTKLCASCKHQDWNKLEPGQTKPACNMSYVWLGVTTDGSPFRFIAGGASVSGTKDFINTIVPKRLPTFCYKLVLTSEQEENESGIFYVVKYNIVGAATPEEAAKLQELTNGMRAMFFEANKIDVNEAEEADEEAAQGGLF